MAKLVKNIPDGFLYRAFTHFHPSLIQYLPKYQNLVFGGATTPEHWAYLCPLCLDNYIVLYEKTIQVKGEFSIEHVPPQCVGGEKLLLTCKECNNKAGSDYEPELKEKMNYEASRNAHKDARIIVNFETPSIDTSKKGIKGFVTKNEEGVNILDFPLKAKENDPRLKHWLDYTSQKEGLIANLTMDRPDDKKILKTLLKSAYLFCFYHWGYDFAFSSNGDLIRNVLNGTQNYALHSYSFWFDKSRMTKEGILPPLGLCMIEKPDELSTFVVNFPLVYKDYIAIGSVMIPYNGDAGWQKLKQMNALPANQDYTISFTPLPIDLKNGVLNGYTQRSKLFH